ncbi:MAG: response regulator [Nitrospirota bacterium]|nr:response regulator [Nitrospirota bacterium]
MEDWAHSRTVLIVDDDQGLISLIKRCLSREGFATAFAYSGQEALAWLSHHHADLLLLDLQLADMSGEDLITHLKHQHLTVPFIVVTGQGDQRLAVQMMKQGARDYFLKDSNLIELLPSIVSQTFEQIQQEQRLKLTENTLRNERERLAITLSSIVEGVFTTDTRGRITYMNHMAEELSGWKQENAMGRSIEEVVRFLHSGVNEADDHPVSHTLKVGTPLHPLDHYPLFDQTQGERPVLYSVSPLRRSDGNLFGAVLILRDMTERIKLDEERLKASKLDSLGLLAGGIAHDFNNLLTTILGNISMTKALVNSRDRLFNFLSEAENASLRAKGLTHKLLTFAKGGTPLKKPLALQHVIPESAGFALSGSPTRCHCEIPDDLWQIEADEGQIGQVIHNLAVNAHQAMPTGGTLSISAENVTTTEEHAKQEGLPKAGNYIKLTIKDNGNGIPPSALHKIFDPYYSTKQNGSGLGLSTAYSIVTNHHGTITATSPQGQGAMFVIHLPAAQVIAPAPQMTASALTGEGRVLVMDDEESIRLLLGEMLRHLGYDVQCVAEGNEALVRYQEAFHAQQPFHAVILDLTVTGGLGGKDTFKQLRQFDPQVKAIVSSGYSNDPVLSGYSTFGFRGVVAKPFRLAELSEVLHQITT